LEKGFGFMLALSVLALMRYLVSGASSGLYATVTARPWR
jgi:hypothetical protein